ncbi:hypothetical protein [Arthrobacter sp. Bz4]|uniref:hypothetical protein n=1 Tax=Arthrobacter sp. Bz4 TaxID=2171979 RepID=UPI00140386B7|nr:hypothetical protein [Arthrobacter sp. Bz4]
MSAPELVVENDVLDVQILRVRNEPMGQDPALAPVVIGDRAEEDVDGTAVVVSGLSAVSLADPTRSEPTQALVAEDLGHCRPHLFGAGREPGAGQFLFLEVAGCRPPAAQAGARVTGRPVGQLLEHRSVNVSGVGGFQSPEAERNSCGGQLRLVAVKPDVALSRFDSAIRTGQERTALHSQATGQAGSQEHQYRSGHPEQENPQDHPLRPTSSPAHLAPCDHTPLPSTKTRQRV